MEKTKERKMEQEKLLHAPNGLAVLILNIFLIIASIFNFIYAVSEKAEMIPEAANYAAETSQFIEAYFIFSLIFLVLMMIAGPILFCGIKILNPNEALVLTLFGKYYGTLREPGIFFVNPFCVSINPSIKNFLQLSEDDSLSAGGVKLKNPNIRLMNSKKISLKNMTLNNEKQKINDLLGNPIIIGIVVIWRVQNTAKAVFNVDDYKEFLSIQCDSALRDVVRLYPYDISSSGDEHSLRGSSQEIAKQLIQLIQERVDIAGLEILEARITHLSYAQEIAAAMLQRQQAAAVIDARKMIVEGAVGMVDMALKQLAEDEIVELDDERKAAMVSNLLVVLCGSKDPQPVVNSGSLY